MRSSRAVLLTAAVCFLLDSSGCVLLGPGAGGSKKESSGGSSSGPESFVDGGITSGKSDAAAPAPGCDLPSDSWSVAAPLSLGAGDVPFDNVQYGTLTLGKGGCLKQVMLSVNLGNDPSCSMNLTAGPYVDAKGRLIVSQLTLTAVNSCPGFPAGFGGVYSAIGSQLGVSSGGTASGTLEFNGKTCSTADPVLRRSCFSGDFELSLHGTANDYLFSIAGTYPNITPVDDGGVAPETSGRLDLEGSHMRIHAAVCDFPSDAELCPKVAAP